jgi:hypothetical protein
MGWKCFRICLPLAEMELAWELDWDWAFPLAVVLVV